MTRISIIAIIGILILVFVPRTLASTLTFTENSSTSLSTSFTIGTITNISPDFWTINLSTGPYVIIGSNGPPVIEWYEPENMSQVNALVFLSGSSGHSINVISDIPATTKLPSSYEYYNVTPVDDGTVITNGIYYETITDHVVSSPTFLNVQFIDAAAASEVPEPSTMLLLGSGLLGLAGLWRKFK